MMFVTRLLLAFALLALVVPGLARAQEGKKLIDKLPEGEPKTDKEFLIKAINAHTADLRSTETVAKRTENKEVRDFANKLIEDHKSLRTDLMAQAQAQKLAIVEGLDKEQRERLARLMELRGAEQDKEFLKQQVECHEKALQMYERWARTTSDNELRDAARRAAKTLRTHLDHARKLQAGLKG
jgi:putative membrane protein